MLPDSSTGRSRHDAVIALALVLLSLGFYARTIGFDFVEFDDPQILLAHPQRYDESSFASSLRAIFIDDFPREEPLFVRDVSWALDARLFGFDEPAGYHGGNVVLNAGVVGLLFLFLRRCGLDPRLAGLVSLAFALAPIHVEPVSWVMGRKDLLAAFFMLSALLAQCMALESTSRSRRALGYGLSLAFCALALGSKISAISLFLVLGLHRAFWPVLQRPRSELERAREGDPDREAVASSASPAALGSWLASLGRRALLPVLPHAMLSIGYFVWYRAMLADYRVIGDDLPGPLDADHLANVFAFGPLIAGEYLRHLVWPHELSVYYRWPHVEIPLSNAEIVGSLAWAGVLVGGLAYALWRRRDLAFFALFSLTLMLPYTGLFYVGFWRADRYFYLASAGVLVIVGIALRDGLLRVPVARRPAAALVGVFLISSAALAYQQQAVWRHNEALWTHEVGRDEPSMLGFQALAREYVSRAERVSDARERGRLVAIAKRVIDLGIERERALGRVASRYRVPEQAQLATLHVLKGRVARLSGAPPDEQAAHYRASYALAPQRTSAMYASESLFLAAQAAPEAARDAMLSESFDYFLLFTQYSSHDPIWLAQCEQILETHYAGRFPILDDRIEEARRIYFP